MRLQNRSTSLNDEQLILAATNGDLDAFNQLVLHYQDMVFNHAYSISGDPDTAEDIAQESFLKAFQGLRNFRGGSFRSWLLRIATNCSYDIFRRSVRRPTQPLYPEDENGEELESAQWLADPTTSVQAVTEQNEFSEDIRALIDKLPETYQNVLILVDVYQFDYQEAAETLQIPIGTIKSRLARARFQMKKLLQETSLYPSSSIASLSESSI